MTNFVTEEYAASLLPDRSDDSHKGSFGTALMFVSSFDMPGAGALAALAAQKGGCGLVRVACPKANVSIIASHVKEAVFLPLDEKDGHIARGAFAAANRAAESADAMLIGCGCTMSDDIKALTVAICESGKKVIIDADAINSLSGDAEKIAGKNALITPHVKEFSRISGKSVSDILSDRSGSAESFAKKYGITVLLKGANTVITDGEKTVVLPFRQSALSTAGSGDVLSGLIVSLAAQGLDLFDAAVLGGYIHGVSGDLCANELTAYATTASDLIARIHLAFKTLSELTNQ